MVWARGRVRGWSLAVLFLLSLSSAVFGQEILWIRQFGTLQWDHATDVAVDQTGNVYVVGSTYGVLPGQTKVGARDAFVRKYNSSGNELWTRQFGATWDGGCLALAVAVDTAGNVYVAGTVIGALPEQTSAGNWDAFLRKYDAAGNAVWTRQFGTDSSDSVNDVAVDGVGNVYVIGQSGQEAYIRKYDSAGNELWTRQFTTAAGWAEAYGVAVDQAGNVYVIGRPSGSEPLNFGGFIRKYDSAGNELWTREFGTAAGAEIYSVATDEAGNLYIAGYTQQALPGQTFMGEVDAFVSKFNSAGDELWVRQFGTGYCDYAWGVVVDTIGNIYVAGSTYGTLPEQTGAGIPGYALDIYVRKYDGAGNEIWTRQFGSTENDDARGIAVDNAGNVYICGWTTGALPEQSNNGWGDAFVAKISQSVLPGQGYIAGKVRDASTSKGIQGATVEASGPITSSTTTDSNGNYTLTLPPGTYTLTASASGYQPQTKTNIDVVSDRTVTVDFALTPVALAEWSFAVITDLHIGFGYPDYGPEGFDDKYGNGQEYYLTERLRKVVETINSDPSIKFVIVLGDLSDSAEYTEFLKAREILNYLNVPYIPVMGNHDAYPYTQATEPLSSAELLGAILPFLDGMDILDFANPTLWDVARDFFLYWWDPLIPLGIPVPGSPLHYQPDIREKELTALYAMGDRYFHEVFWGPENQQNVSRLEALFGLERQYHDSPEDPHQPMFHNYVFEYSGIRFIVLDCNERKLDASGAKLSPETEEWLKTKLVRDQPTILLAHQPLIMSQLPEPLGTQCFSEADLAKIRDIINQSGARILAAFGGHTHGNFYANPQYDQALDKEIPIFVPLLNKQKKISISIGAKSMLSCDVFITEAVAKETARWLEWFRQTFPDWYGRFPFSTRDGACVRIVRMRGDEIIEQRTIRVTEEQNLPPVAYFTNFPKGEKVPCLVHLTAFPYDPDGNPSNFKYSWDLGGGKAWSDPNEREVWVHFPGRGDYAVTLYVTDEGGAKASFTRIIPVRSLFEIILKSPADLVVIDPDGYTLTKDISEVPGMSYFQIDLFSNGSVEDLVAVWEKKLGNYVIKVIPEPDARPDDVYTLQILFGNEVITLANNVKISNIPEQYTIRVTETEIIPVGYVPLGKVVTHGPNPVPAEGCIFWLALPADTVSATLKIYAVDGAFLVSIPLDPTADHYPPVGRWVPQDSNGRLLGTGLYLYLVEIHHADGRVTYSPLQKMVIKR
jgi:hypothetical protein